MAVLFLLPALFFTAACGGGGGDGAGDNWLPFDEGITLAAREKKPVVIDFYTSWCKWCKVMDEKTFSDSKVRRYLEEHFVTIRINAESTKDRFTYKGKEYTPLELTQQFGVKGFPSLAYLDREGELITVVPGFVPAKTFLPLLNYINKECYRQRMTFDEFLKKKEECAEENRS